MVLHHLALPAPIQRVLGVSWDDPPRSLPKLPLLVDGKEVARGTVNPKTGYLTTLLKVLKKLQLVAKYDETLEYELLRDDQGNRLNFTHLMAPAPTLSEEADATLSTAAEGAVADGAFEPKNDLDARERALRAISLRQGQPEFRRQVLEAFGRRCMVTGCSAEEVLEAAHIRPYRGEHTNGVENGLLLRADIHTLFDRGLLAFHTTTSTVVVHTRLNGTEYAALAGREVQLSSADVAALEEHRKRSGL